ncbi:MAG TPA: cold shock domain-containing protein [Chitinophagaceae bacterium]|nr:cold shock domain-containing protein [Chitinophagaceae bacterium]
MAKSKETFNKKEKEKKRLKQQQEKRQKMEQRKMNAKKGKTLEEMMAYLDENGNLTDKPPDPRIKRIFKQEDIQIGVPKREEIEYAPRTGVVTFFDQNKGFGFINDQQSNQRVFFHINNLTEEVNESDKVIFDIEIGPRGPNALNVAKAN